VASEAPSEARLDVCVWNCEIMEINGIRVGLASASQEDKKTVEIKNQQVLAAVSERTANLKATIKIKNFDRAVHKAPMCEHLRVQNWGDCYGKGLRCLDCGKELTKTDEEVGQQKGIGSGEDPSMVADVVLHRANESSFKFKDGKHLRRVENERARLEKERREMSLTRNVFYDYEDVKAIYEFDRRHKIYFKDQGVVRQGVQWTDRELSDLKEKKIEEIKEIDPLHQMQAKVDFDMFYASFNPPTFRAEMVKSEAAFHGEKRAKRAASEAKHNYSNSPIFFFFHFHFQPTSRLALGFAHRPATRHR